jgi:ADP-ribose pyrophosphatase YjhB (NUDIX family)
LNLRPAVRVMLLDPADRVLLVRWHFPDQPADRGPRDVWGTPGGGIEAGESHPEAVLRELREETGLRLDPSDCGPCVAHRRHVIPFGGGYDGQEEWFYLVRVPALDPAPALTGADRRGAAGRVAARAAVVLAGRGRLARGRGPGRLRAAGARRPARPARGRRPPGDPDRAGRLTPATG